eukprot:1656456-Rhodomonas_salina.1
MRMVSACAVPSAFRLILGAHAQVKAIVMIQKWASKQITHGEESGRRPNWTSKARQAIKSTISVEVCFCPDLLSIPDSMRADLHSMFGVGVEGQGVREVSRR